MIRERYLITKRDLNLIEEDVDSLRIMLGFIKKAKDNANQVEDYCERVENLVEHLKHLLVIGDFE